MKFLVLVFVIAGVAFASSSLSGTSAGSGIWFPETDDVLDTYAYGDDVCGTIPASFGDYRVVDDFQTAKGATISSFTYWGLSTGAIPTSLNLMQFADDSGAPGTEVFQTDYSIVSTNSGFTYAGYVVYKCDMAVSLPLATGTYWFGFHRPGATNWYVGIGPTVTGYEAYRTLAAGYVWEAISVSIEAADLFKIVEGATALERTTWGSIKNLF